MQRGNSRQTAGLNQTHLRKKSHALTGQATLGGEGVLQSILDIVPDALIVIDEHGIVVSFSATAEKMFGFSAAEVCGHNVSMLMPSPHRELHDSYIERYMKTGERRVIGTGRVVVGLRKDGSTFPIELAVGEVNQGPRHLFIGFIRDLTERQQTQKRLQELQSELSHIARVSEMGQMATGIAHELNQPLAAATNYLSAARRIIAGPGDTAKIADYVEKASDQVKRAAEIIQRIRHFARKGEPDCRAERLSKLLEESSGVALIGAKERGVKVTTHIASDLPDVLVDRVQIQQVIVNLIRNAIEAMESSSVRELTLEANPYAERVIVRISDTGRGIAPGVAQRLFEPFVTTKEQGMGVGLAICQSIIRGHGGEIWVEPNAEGGTSFLFTLPQA